MSNMIFENTWEENKRLLETKKVLIVPVGSNEQHGPALPLGTDWMIAEHLAREIGRKTDKALVAPTVTMGHALYHDDFPGTMAVSQVTLFNYVREICEPMLKHGITHILFINGHGGNNNALYDVGQYFRHKNIPVANIQWYEVAGCMRKEWGLRGHGDIGETAMMLHVAPETVRMDRAHIPQNKTVGNIKFLDLHRGEFEGASVYLNLRTKDITDSGDLMEFGHSTDVDYSTSPAEATAELGAAMCEACVDYAVRFIDEFVNFKF